jgi:hypothetical protein
MGFNLGVEQVMVDSKEQFVRKMNDIRTRTLVERDNLTADQVRREEMISTRRCVLLFGAPQIQPPSQS